MRALAVVASLSLLAGCGGEAEGASEDEGQTTEGTLSGAEEARAQKAAARRAADAITEENADDTLDDLEAIIGREDE
jgi:hypothetical protein